VTHWVTVHDCYGSRVLWIGLGLIGVRVGLGMGQGLVGVMVKHLELGLG